MKALLFSDLHGSLRALKKLKEVISRHLAESNDLCLVFAGDLVNMGEPVDFVEKFTELINDFKLQFLWVPGNNDFGRSYHTLYEKIPSLEGTRVVVGNRVFTGIGGTPASWSSDYEGESQQFAAKDIAGSILVTHIPPFGIINYMTDEAAANNFIQYHTTQNKKLSHFPLVHICGHYHNQYGLGFLGKTKIVKLAAMELGHYAVMDTEDLRVKFFKEDSSITVS